MTAQISDKFLFKGEKYSLIGMTGGSLADPRNYGMEPEMISTACFSGYYATYELTEEALYLRELTVRDRNGNYPPIGGIEPAVQQYEALYQGLNEIVNFTGKIRLAKDFIDELYIHMGFQKPTAFRTVLDITLEEGRPVNINDRSKEMEKKRGEFKKRYESKRIEEQIDKAFSLDMDLE